ncbi:MAG: class I SAM-dependent methyltransferase [Chloroflexi bacterium]|nr:class I SAM-dependent methyltransferase [Chloroflexota bacterium]
MMQWRNYLLPYDLYERHAVVSRLLRQKLGENQNETQLLDVGGRSELLARFLPYQIVSVNPDGTGDVLGSGLSLPFANNAFDAVMSIDTLEHIPPANRLPFLRECVRVARQYVIVAAPFGTPEHISFEASLNDLYTAVTGHPHLYLNEHVQNGLPTPQHLQQFAAALAPAKTAAYYAGNFVWQGNTFKRGIHAYGRSRLTAAAINYYNQISSMALFHPIKLSTTPTNQANRFYLMIHSSD